MVSRQQAPMAITQQPKIPAIDRSLQLMGLIWVSAGFGDVWQNLPTKSPLSVTLQRRPQSSRCIFSLFCSRKAWIKREWNWRKISCSVLFFFLLLSSSYSIPVPLSACKHRYLLLVACLIFCQRQLDPLPSASIQPFPNHFHHPHHQSHLVNLSPCIYGCY